MIGKVPTKLVKFQKKSVKFQNGIHQLLIVQCVSILQKGAFWSVGSIYGPWLSIFRISGLRIHEA